MHVPTSGGVKTIADCSLTWFSPTPYTRSHILYKAGLVLSVINGSANADDLLMKNRCVSTSKCS
jgi:hypothetical protein